jgi:hypothetical protein
MLILFPSRLILSLLRKAKQNQSESLYTQKRSFSNVILFIYGLQNDAVSSSDYAPWKEMRFKQFCAAMAERATSWQYV